MVPRVRQGEGIRRGGWRMAGRAEPVVWTQHAVEWRGPPQRRWPQLRVRADAGGWGSGAAARGLGEASGLPPGASDGAG